MHKEGKSIKESQILSYHRNKHGKIIANLINENKEKSEREHNSMLQV